MPQQPHQPDDLSELLSAYLDGELTADEQARVEARLNQSAEFRQLHEELRAVRANIDSLPRYQLDSDFAASVLRRAERAMLATPAVKPLTARIDASVMRPEAATPRDRVVRGLRAFRWSIVALAVALLIMIFNPGEQQKEPNVALVKDRSDESAQKEASPAANRVTTGDGEMIAAPAKLRALEAVPPGRAVQADGAEEEVAAEKQSDAPAAALPQQGLARKSAMATPADAAYDAEAVATEADKDLHGDPLGGVGGGKFAADDRAKRIDRDEATAGEPRLRQQSKEPLAGRRAASAERAIPADALVVQCDISAEAAKSQVFEQLLAEQQIELTDAQAAAGQLKAREDKPKEDALADAVQPMQAILVEASPAQVSATLAALQARDDQFLSLQFQSAADRNAIGGEREQAAAIDAKKSVGQAASPVPPSQARGNAYRIAVDALPLAEFAAPSPTGGDKNERSKLSKSGPAPLSARSLAVPAAAPKLEAAKPQSASADEAPTSALAAPAAPAAAASAAKANGMAADGEGVAPVRVLFLLRVVPSAEPKR